MALKPGNNLITLTYKNEKTLEYIFYKLHLEITEPDVQGEYKLATIVRDTVTKMITIENPLKKDVVFVADDIKFELDNCNL